MAKATGVMYGLEYPRLYEQEMNFVNPPNDDKYDRGIGTHLEHLPLVYTFTVSRQKCRDFAAPSLYIFT